MKIILFPELLNITSKDLQKGEWESYEDLGKFINCLETKTVSEVILPLCFTDQNIKWNDFYGLELIKKIRYDLKQRCSIVVCSVLPKNILQQTHFKAYEKSKILAAPGTYFLSYPWEIKSLPTLRKISENALDDINHAFFNPKGNASEIIHNLKNKFGEIANDSRSNELFKNLKEIIEVDFKLIETDVLPENRLRFHSVKNQMFEDLETDISNFIKQKANEPADTYHNTSYILDKYSEIIYGLLPKELKDNENEEVLKTPWQVLYIDDTEFCRNDVVAKFDKRGINCIAVHNGKEAIDVLLKDTKGKISVVISDIRLYQSNNDDWQDLQGYDLLNEIHEVNNSPISYFVLTSKRGTIVDSVKRKAKFPIQWFSKSDVTTSEQGFNIFTKRVKELGGENWFWKKSQPKMSAWTKESHRFTFPLSKYYRKHVELSDHPTIKSEINSKAKTYIENILKNKKNEVIEFLPTLKDETVSNKMIEKFRFQILLGRRIIYSLWLNKMDEESIFYALRPKGEYTKENRDLLFASTMAVSFKNDVPSDKDIEEGNLMGCNLLEEEIDFLIDNYNLNPEIRNLKLNISDLDLVYEILDHFRAKIELLKIQTPKEIEAFLDRYYADKLITISEIDKALKVSAKIAKDKAALSEFRKGLIQKLENLQSPKVMALFEKHF
jgi:CheY-like chemotaxis protein